MKGKILVSRFWTKVFSFGKAEAITIFPFIFLKRAGLKVRALKKSQFFMSFK